LVAIQLVPVNRSNPPETGPIQTSLEVGYILQRSCYDCHSNRTVWPWYAKVAPTSWFVTHHVKEGREHLNFSEWASLSEHDQEKLKDEIYEEIAEGKMPLKGYVQLHGEAKLSGADLNLIKKWVE